MRARLPLAAGAVAAGLLAGAPGAPAQAPSELLRPAPPEPAATPAQSGPRGETAQQAATPTTPRRRRRLSNERTRSRWAFVVRPVWARRAPHARSRHVKRLRTRTPDRTEEVVLLLADLRTSKGELWVKVRLPMRPNNRTGWVPRRALGRYRLTEKSLRIDRRRFRATLYKRGRAIWRARIGVGQPRWPTPRGRFYIRSRLLPLDPNGLYGVFAFGLSAYSDTLTDWPGGGMIGIHGTNQPELIPGRISHGCIRVRNSRISRLRRLLGVGTPVRIR